MNHPDSDNPLITRYALQDLPAAEHDAVQAWVESDPALQDEVADIQHLAETLRATAPLHELRLTASQRRAVLQPPVRKPLSASPRTAASRPHHAAPRRASFSFTASLLRVAALVALGLGAFWIGRQTQPVEAPLTAATVPEPVGETPSPAPAVPSVEPPAAHQPEPAEPAPTMLVTGIDPAADAPATTAAPGQTEDEPVVAAAPAMQESTLPTAAKAAPAGRAAAKLPSFGLATTKAAAPFINASRSAADQIALHPRQVRPAPASSGAALQAKPLDPAQTPAKDASANRKKPDLYIHSWSAEIAACPWDSQLRLLRVTLQLPADQEAVLVGDPDYPLEVTFDPNNVRQFRRLGTRHIPSPELRSAGYQVIWYEFQPNGSPASAHENGKHIATVRLPAARFTTQTVGPFDASRLQVLDRGLDWRQARDDFRFETAMLGLGLLLDGGLPGSQLNHQLLLQLAESAQGADTEGGRARLVQTLRQLAQWTGR